MRKIVYAFFVSLSILQISIAQHAVGRMTVNFKDPSRTGGTSTTAAVQMPGTGRDIATELFYPATTAGTNVPLANGQFPVVVLGHGFVMGFESYNNISNELAQSGYIVALPRTEGSFSPNHLEFGRDISFIAGEILSFNTLSTPTPVAIFNGKVKQRAALSGHSMGGGCSLVGAQNNSTIACVFNMAAATSNTPGVSSLAGASLVTVPALVISGEKDCVVDTNVQNAHYNALASTQKFHVVLKDLTHCDFGTGTNFNCTFGQTTSGCPNTISNALAHKRYMNYLHPFLKRYLYEDCAAGQAFMDSITGNSNYRIGRKITGTAVCNTSSVRNLTENDFRMFPIPAKQRFDVEFPEKNQIWQIEIYLLDLNAKEISLEGRIEKNQNKITVNTRGISPGIYFLKVQTGSETIFRKLLIEE